MGRVPRRRSESGVYHVMSRGAGKQVIFEDDADRQRYMLLLFRVFPVENDVELLAWCLMDNHVHLLLLGDLGQVAERMRLVSSMYATYFNRRYERSGHLFQGRFKSEPVDGDAHFMTVVRYIHQNPLKAGVTADCRYAWSSYQALTMGEPRGSGQEFLLDVFWRAGVVRRISPNVS